MTFDFVMGFAIGLWTGILIMLLYMLGERIYELCTRRYADESHGTRQMGLQKD